MDRINRGAYYKKNIRRWTPHKKNVNLRKPRCKSMLSIQNAICNEDIDVEIDQDVADLLSYWSQEEGMENSDEDIIVSKTNNLNLQKIPKNFSHSVAKYTKHISNLPQRKINEVLDLVNEFERRRNLQLHSSIAGPSEDLPDCCCSSTIRPHSGGDDNCPKKSPK